MSTNYVVSYSLSGREEQEGYRVVNVLGSYVHLHFRANENIARSFVDAANCEPSRDHGVRMMTRAGEYVTEIVRGIEAPSAIWRKIARERLDTLTKPLGSLGRLEDLAAKMVAIRRGHVALPIGKAVYVFAADHGIVAEGVSAYPSAVTYQMVLNFLRGGAAVSVLARMHGAALHVVDVGVDADFEGVEGLAHRKVARGTANMLHGGAMTEGELVEALRVGAELGQEAAAAGHTLIAVGEMGIGNTTAASAITCALLGCAAASATGKGTGLDAQAHERKVRVIGAVLAKHFGGTEVLEPLDILRCVGGLEIAAMSGMMLAAARHRVGILVDGFISTAAAAVWLWHWNRRCAGT